MSVLPVTLRAEPPAAVLPGALWVAGDPLDYTWAVAQRIDVVVDLSVGDQRPDASEIVALDYRKHPLIDHVLPGADVLDQIVPPIVADVRQGRRIVVHCGTGRNRSGLVVALAVREVLGCSGAEAMAAVRAARPGALADRGYARYVASLPAPAG